MLKRLFLAFLLIFNVALSGCVTGVAGLNAYVDSLDGYQFLYPNGWLQVKVSSGADVVFHDLIQTTENVSVVISPISKGRKLTDIGTPAEVGQKLAKNLIAVAKADWTVELVTANARENGTQTYYNLEYVISPPPTGTGQGAQPRHQVAAVAVSRGKLFTLSLSVPEGRWPRVENQFHQVANSFLVY
jgi:photosystem II oxygen-evolving enhancer protein 2